MMPTSSEPEREQEQWIEIRSLTCKNCAHPPLWRRICSPDDAFGLEKDFRIKVFTIGDGRPVGKIYVDDAMWFLSDCNSLSPLRAKALIGNLRGTEREQEDLHSSCVASDWMPVDARIGFSSTCMALMAKVDEAGVDRDSFCFGNSRKLNQCTLAHRPSLWPWERRRPWLVAWHGERAILSPARRFADEVSACGHLLEQLIVTDEWRKRSSRRL